MDCYYKQPMSFDDNNNNHILSEDNILKTSDLEYTPEGGLGYEFYRFMNLYGENIAQYDAESGTCETYSSFLKRCIRTAMKLKSDGITRNDAIFLCTNNHMDSAVPFVAASFLGAKIASLDPTLSRADTKHLIENVIQPSVIFLIPECVEMIEDVLKEAKHSAKLVVFSHDSVSGNLSTFSDYCSEPREDENDFGPVRTDPHETEVVFFSSGTTGFPKGICQSGYALLGQSINNINNGFACGPVMCFSSLYWISSALLLVTLIVSGKPRIVTPYFDAEKLWRYIDKFKISYVFLAPNQALDMVKVGRPDNLNTSSLQCLLTGGAAMAARQFEILRDVLPGTFVTQAYGQTEVAGPATIFKINDPKDAILLHYKSAACGRPLNGIWYKVVDTETEEALGSNQQGELRLKSKFVMNGYHNMDSSDCFDADGWLKTGDIVYYDEDFCFYIVDRIKEMLKFRSWHIPPAMLETILNSHSAVKKSVVIGIPHEEDGDLPMALIIREKGCENVGEDELMKFVDEKVLDRQRLRGGIRFMEEFPMTPSGKIKRQMLKKMMLNEEI